MEEKMAKAGWSKVERRKDIYANICR